jgi:hypothetical protein
MQKEFYAIFVIALLCVTFLRKYKGNEKVNLERR